MIKKLLTKSHIYLGLFFVIDLWLFSLTGLFLNHPQWAVNEYREAAEWIETTVAVTSPGGQDPVEKAHHYLRELSLEGELVSAREIKAKNEFRFDVYRPGNNVRVRIDVESGTAKVGRQKVDGYGMLNQLHTFSAMKRFDPKKGDLTWYATRLWVITMDGLALSLIILGLTAVYMWLQTKKIISGAISLLLGTGIAIVFLLL